MLCSSQSLFLFHTKLYLYLMKLRLVSKYQPKGDQPKAIKDLVKGVNEGEKNQT